MAQYTVQDPQGNNRVIEGPDGASDEEIISHAKQLFGQTGSMPSNDPIQAFKTALANHPARPNPIAGFDQDVNQAPNATDPTGQRLLENASIAAGGYGAGSLAGSLVNGAVNKGASFLDTLKTSKAAPELAGTETPIEAGNTIATSQAAEQAANKATSNALYAKIPKDLKAPLDTAQSTADSIINEVKELPQAFQSKKILSLAGDLQDMENAPIGTIQTMNSTLKDIAANGEGIEKVYAARLSNALNTDLANFGKTDVVQKAISSGPSLEAMDLRKSWVDAARQTQQPGLEDLTTQGAFINPANVHAPTTSITNSDVPANINRATSYYKDMSQLNNNPLARALDRAALESKANVIFKGGRVDDINTARALLGDKGFDAAQGQFYQKLLNSKNIGQAMAKYSPEFLKEALTPGMQKALDAVHLINQVSARAKVAAGIAAGGTVIGGAYAAGRKLIH